MNTAEALVVATVLECAALAGAWADARYAGAAAEDGRGRLIAP